MTGESALSPRLIVMHVVAGLHPNSGGPSRTVVQLTDALAGQPNVDVTLLSQTLAGEPSVASGASEVDRRMSASSSPRAIRFALPIRQALGHTLRERCPSIVHSHGLWSLGNHWASRASRRHGIPRRGSDRAS